MADVADAQLVAAQETILVVSTTYYLNFCTGDPGVTGANEASGVTRQAITFGTPTTAAPSVQSSTNSQSFSSMPGSATYTYFGIWTVSSGGSFLRGGSLTSSITPAASSTVTCATGAFTVSAQ